MLRPTQRQALLKLQALGRPAEWQEFSLYERADGKCGNAFRWLERRGLVRDVNAGQPPPRKALYVLSHKGERELHHSSEDTTT